MCQVDMILKFYLIGCNYFKISAFIQIPYTTVISLKLPLFENDGSFTSNYNFLYLVFPFFIIIFIFPLLFFKVY